MPHLRFTLEEHLRQFVEGVVGEASVSHHKQVLQQFVGMYLCHHIVLSKHPFTIFQTCKLLLYLHILHPVYVTVVRHIEVAFLYMKGAVGGDI